MSNDRVALYKGSKVVHIRQVDVRGWCKAGWSKDKPVRAPKAVKTPTPKADEPVEVMEEIKKEIKKRVKK